MDDEPGSVVRRQPVKRLIALSLFGVLLLALLVLWTQRFPLAEGFIERELERRNVQASYRLERIGFRTQRLENLVIGDPGNPDLTARWVEVRLRWRLGRPRIALLTARGVRLYGRLADGRLSLGEVDRLLPPPSGLPFRFPDQNVDVADAAVRLDTPAGRIGIGLSGRGNLADGFRGRMAAVGHDLRLGECRLTGARAYSTVAIDDLKPSFRGPVQAGAVACGRYLALARPSAGLELTLAEALDAWRGRAVLAADGARFGPNEMRALAGRISFDGNSKATGGALDLASTGARLDRFAAARASVEGRYSLSLDDGRLSLLGEAALRGASGRAAAVTDALASLRGTPLEPIGDSIAAAVGRALGGFDSDAAFRLVAGPGVGGIRIERLGAVSRSGARLALADGAFTYYWRTGDSRLDGELALSGGGFPATRVSLDQAGAGAPIRGVARVAPMRSGAARLALADIVFTAAPGGLTRIETAATLSGPFEDGRIEGLVVPISGRLDGRGGFALGERCLEARFGSLRAAGLVLGPSRLPLCPVGRALLWRTPGGPVRGGMQVAPARFAGRLGASPISLASSRLRLDWGASTFSGSDIAVLLGAGEGVNRLDVASLSGRFAGRGVGGDYAGLSAKLANVPLLLSEGAGRWNVRGGDLFLAGSLRVADAIDPPRFWPMVSDDFRLSLVDNVVRAEGWLDDPEKGRPILRADVEHALRTGRGRALLDVPGIRFDRDYQPDDLTRLTTGVVALVEGVVTGRGEIRWDEAATTSTGTFSTENMNLAAAFGPVEGLTTTLNFTDLLGLVTAPGQIAEVDRIRTGIDVLDGRIRYQLLPDLHVRVEGARWPFAGGDLILEETVLDFSKPTPKRLTFRVVGLDAAEFIRIMEFSNIRATGTFDGIIPMVFDERGGRVEGGSLVARAEGGTLSYIGELTDKDLGAYGKLAFDALKALRYSKLTIALDGSLSGEFVAGIELDGIARDPALTSVPSGGLQGAIAGRALSQLARIPFEFNIRVRGPFRALIATARSFEDPTDLIQSALPAVLRKRDPLAPVQPQESEDVP